VPLCRPLAIALPMFGHVLAYVLSPDNKDYVNLIQRNLLITKRNRIANAHVHAPARRPAHPPSAGRKGPISRVCARPKRPPALALDRVLTWSWTVTLSLSINRLWLRARKERMFSRQGGAQKGSAH
jgi:hypothetical protein